MCVYTHMHVYTHMYVYIHPPARRRSISGRTCVAPIREPPRCATAAAMSRRVSAAATPHARLGARGVLLSLLLSLLVSAAGWISRSLSLLRLPSRAAWLACASELEEELEEEELEEGVAARCVSAMSAGAQRQYLYVCTSKASKLSTGESVPQEARFLRAAVLAHAGKECARESTDKLVVRK